MSKKGNYSRYTTNFKLAVKLGIADPSHVKALPRTTRHNFRNMSFEDLIGKEYEGLSNKISTLREILDSQTATAVALAMARFALFIKKIGKDAASLATIKDSKIRRQFVSLVKGSEDFIPRKKILNYFGTYAIAASLIRKHTVMAGLSTIMEYARKLGLHMRSIRKKKQKRGSVAAEKINQYWHMDVTRLISADNEIHYLHLVMDNCSRKILSWHLSTRLRAYNSRRVIKAALKGMNSENDEPVNLITDGGSENVNVTVKDFLKNTDVNLLVAQRDVHFSNSMVEAVNRTLKYRHIFPHQIPEAHKLREFVKRAIEEYNNRPHSRLNLLTPTEKYVGIEYSKKKYTELRDEARLIRMRQNRKSCPPLEMIKQKTKERAMKFPLIPKSYSKIMDRDGKIVSVSCVGCAKCR